MFHICLLNSVWFLSNSFLKDCLWFASLESVPWAKKGASGDMFDITMGSYDGAESCKLVAVLVLSQFKIITGEEIGLYRNDGLTVLHAPPKAIEQTKKKICELFRKKGLKITIEANKKSINFLDVTLDLQSGKHCPYLEEGNVLQYIHSKSNHPPSIVKQIPESINRRLSNISSDEAAFEKAALIYQAALEKSGHTYKLKFQPRSEQRKRTPHSI